MIDTQIWQLFLMGAAGGLIKDLMNDGCIEMPKKIDSKLSLGFISSIIIGAFAGYFIDGSILTAFMGGYMGSSVITQLLPKTKIVENTQIIDKVYTQEESEAIIRSVCKEYGVDEDLAVRISKCESGLKNKAVGVNTTGSRDRGLFQWNDQYHPDITDEMAFDPYTATKLFCKAIKEGHIDWWNSSKKCWG